LPKSKLIFIIEMQWIDEYMFPHSRAAEQKTCHLAITPADVCNRVITMGSKTRAYEIAQLLDTEIFRQESEGFLIITGTYNTVPVTILCCGIGFPNVDIMIREIRSVIDGTILLIRLGSAGTAHNDVDVGHLVVASKGSTYLQRNPDAFNDNNNSKNYYTIFDNAPADPKLTNLILENLKGEKDVVLHEGMNASTDFFYGSQGRKELNFIENNDTLLTDLYCKYPEVKSIEMETYHLFDLARHCKSTIKTSALVIIRSHRYKTSKSLPMEEYQRLEKLSGLAVLKAITSYQIPKNE